MSALPEELVDELENLLVEYDESGHMFGESGAGALFLAERVGAWHVAKLEAGKPHVETLEELMSLPTGTVVHSIAGTVGCRYSEDHGVVFGMEGVFPWSQLALPVVVLLDGDR